jgi:hypothetical protein
LIDLRGILEKRLERQLTIIECLWDETWKTTAEIATEIGCSERTIRADIQLINEMLPSCFIQTSFKDGLYLNKTSSTSKASVYAKILTKSLEFQLLEYIFFHQNLSKTEVCDNLFISSTQLDRLITKINSVIKKHGFIINNKMELTGEELQIRGFFTAFFQEKYGLFSTLMTSKQDECLDQLIELFIESNTIFMLSNNDQHLFLCTMKIQLFVSLTRMKQKNGLSVPNHIFEPSTIVTNRKMKEALCAHFGFEDIDRVVKEIGFEFSVPIHPSLRIDTATDVSTVKKRIKQLMATLEDRYEVSCDSKDLLAHDIVWSILNVGKPTYILHNKKKEFFESVLDDQPILTNFLQEQFFDIYKSCFDGTLSIYRDEMIHQSIYKLISSWKRLRNKVREEKFQLKVGLLFNNSHDYLCMLKEDLEFYFRNSLLIDIMSPKKRLVAETLQNYDCVLTDLFIDSPYQEKVIGITNYLTKETINHIVDYYYLKQSQAAKKTAISNLPVANIR